MPRRTGRLRRPAGSRFSQVPSVKTPRSRFDLSHGHKTTFNAGQLVPILVDEMLPGDTYNLRMHGFVRLATPLVPIMDNLYLETFFFAVPNRLLWDNWARFCGEQREIGPPPDFLIPHMSGEGVVETGSVADYMGIPLDLDFGETMVSALPFRAYRLIWYEWFRDENLQLANPIDTGDGPDNLPFGSASAPPLPRGKRHDYFTSALPWPQKGESVMLPLGESAPISGLGVANQVFGDDTSADGGVFETHSDQAINYDHAKLISDSVVDRRVYVRGTEATGGELDVFADLTQATAASINEIRQAFQLQKLLERDARGGTRYTEIVLSHFGVTSPDARLQRPEYLGGGHTPIIISPVAQTSSTDETSPQAHLAAVGTGSLSGHGFSYSATEHCTIIGLCSVRADLNYQQGLDRMWSRRTRFDFYWPSLAHLGEQAILNKEIYHQGTEADDDVFGYQERFAEYRYRASRITGLFRSSAFNSLDIWHLAQNFDELPMLNSQFIVDQPPVDRIVATPEEPHFLADFWFRLRAARPMPVYGVPGLIDHF